MITSRSALLRAAHEADTVSADYFADGDRLSASIWAHRALTLRERADKLHIHRNPELATHRQALEQVNETLAYEAQLLRHDQDYHDNAKEAVTQRNRSRNGIAFG